MKTPLIDSFGRVHTDLRISLTDRCNFRCQYCMPADGLEWMPKANLLSFEEIFSVAQLCVERLGVKSIRLTGGEPTLRSELPKLVEMLASLEVDLAMTTNGTTLPKLAAPLKQAGLNRLNISLDSLNPERFFKLTRRDELHKVLRGIKAASAAGFGADGSSPIKINMVVMRGTNEDELLDFLKFGLEHSVLVRFIEFMPLDADEIWSRNLVVGLDEILEVVRTTYELEEMDQGSSPASRFRYKGSNAPDGLQAEFGVIASVTQSFCHLCNRVRLTADGQFRSCLFSTNEYNLKDILRSSVLEEEKIQQLTEIITQSVSKKWAGHSINKPQFIRPSRSMSQIGG